MSAITVTNVIILDNPAPFVAPFQLDISYECIRQLEDDLEWKLIYVGSAENEKYDQVLESVFVGPVQTGTFRFILQADAPVFEKIPETDVLGVTVLLLTCSYKEEEFIRIGYYVNNEYTDEELKEEPPAKPIISKILRNVMADKPRVTKFPILWDADIPGEVLQPEACEGGTPVEVPESSQPLIVSEHFFPEDTFISKETSVLEL